MEVNHQVLFLLCLLNIKAGFSAEIPVFVQTGDSVQLDIQTQELPKDSLLYWTKDKSDNIIRYDNETNKVVPHQSYKDRMDFNVKTLSLTLKNMQKTDSGLYTARITEQENKDIVTYRVSVIDAVTAPVLTVNSNSSIGDSCTVNFTCRAHELTINSSYQDNRCPPQEVTSQENYTLILSSHCSEEFIICNYSNPVSWREDRKKIIQSHLCVKDEKAVTETNLIPIITSIVVVLVLVGILCLVSFLCYKKLNKGAQEGGRTVYDQVQGHEMQKKNSDFHTYDVPERIEAQPQEGVTDKRPNTTYCTVGQFKNPTIHTETDHTIYSSVCKQQPKKQNDAEK